MSTTLTSERAFTVKPRHLAIAGVAALAANLASYGLGSLGDASWRAGQPYPISVVAVIAATFVVFSLGGVATTLISQRRSGFPRVAAWGGLAFGLLSMGALINAEDLATALALGAMHLATAIAWFVSLRAPGKA